MLHIVSSSQIVVECLLLENRAERVKERVLVISMSYRTSRKPLEALRIGKEFKIAFFVHFFLLSQYLKSFSASLYIFRVVSRNSEAFKAPSDILLYVLLKCSPQFYVWCIVVMTCVFCTARWFFPVLCLVARQKKTFKTFSLDRENKTESCRILEWSELFFFPADICTGEFELSSVVFSDANSFVQKQSFDY